MRESTAWADGYGLRMGVTPLPQARRLRIAAVALIVAWFFLPRLQAWIPLWVPFVAFAALELHFLVAGLREGGGVPQTRGRSPQAVDVAELGGEEWLEPALVRIEGRDVWLPATGKTEEQLEELVEEARERLRRGEDPDWPDEQPVAAAAPPRPRLLPRLEGLAVLGALAFVLLVLVPDRGWKGLDASERERTEARLSAEAGRIAGHDARVRCDAEGRAVGIVQHADGLAEVGGTNAYLTPAICFRLHRLAFDGDEGSFEPDGPRARRARARGVASPRRERRGDRELLRLPERGRARSAARPLGAGPRRG